MLSKSSNILFLDQIQENIIDVIQKSKSNQNTIEALNPQFKSLVREIYDMFHTNTIVKDEEINNTKIKEILKQFLESNNNEFIYQYSSTSLPNVSSKEIITFIFVLMLAQRLFAVFILYLMTLEDLKTIYKENAVLRNLDDMIQIQKSFNKFEIETISIQSKWIQQFYSQKQILDKKDNFSPLNNNVNGNNFDFLKFNSEYFDSLQDDDPIKKWYQGGNDLQNLLFEKQISQKNDKKPILKQNFLKSKISDNEVIDQKEIPIIEENENNDVFRHLLEEGQKKPNKQEKKNLFSEENSETSDIIELSDDNKSPNSQKLQRKLFPTINQLNDLLTPIKPSEKTQQCEFCEQKFKNYFYKTEGIFCLIIQKWFCDKCCSKYKYLIPSNIWNEKNYKKQWVSLEGEKKLIEIYNTPIFLITKHNKEIINEQMNKFILYRKQLHLMFDQICNPYVILEIFKNRENLLLKDLYLSLFDIEEIIFGDLQQYINEKIRGFSAHFNTCPICNQQKIECYSCQEKDIFLWDLFRTIICPKCRALFHRQCFNKQNCPSCLNLENKYQLINKIKKILSETVQFSLQDNRNY